MNKKIFISYRRDDTQYQVDILHEEMLKYGIPKENIFKDIESISLGVNFDEAIDQALESADIALIIIGEHWFDEKNKKRLQDPNDFVRREVAKSLQKQNKVVVPVLYSTQMPPTDELPDDLKDLWRKNAIEITRKHMHEDIKAMLERLNLIAPDIELAPSSSPVGKIAVKRSFAKNVVIGVAVFIFLIILLVWWAGSGDNKPSQNKKDTTAQTAINGTDGVQSSDKKTVLGTKTDACVGYCKIKRLTFSQNGTKSIMELKIVDIPKTLTFNQASLKNDDLEYQWGILVDLDGDGIYDYAFSLAHWKNNQATLLGSLDENTEVLVEKEKNKDFEIINNFPIDVKIVGNSIIFTVEESAKFKITNGHSILKAYVTIRGDVPCDDISPELKL